MKIFVFGAAPVEPAGMKGCAFSGRRGGATADGRSDRGGAGGDCYQLWALEKFPAAPLPGLPAPGGGAAPAPRFAPSWTHEVGGQTVTGGEGHVVRVRGHGCEGVTRPPLITETLLYPLHVWTCPTGELCSDTCAVASRPSKGPSSYGIRAGKCAITLWLASLRLRFARVAAPRARGWGQAGTEGPGWGEERRACA